MLRNSLLSQNQEACASSIVIANPSSAAPIRVKHFQYISVTPATSRLCKAVRQLSTQCNKDFSVTEIRGKPAYSQVAFSGGGLFFWWQLGSVRYLEERFGLHNVRFIGASSGALVSTIAACQVDPDQALKVANRLSQELEIWTRPLGLMGVWGQMVRQWLYEILPENAADMVRNRLIIVVTRLPDLSLQTISEFDTKDDLIDALMASVHIPMFLDYKPFTLYNGQICIDGSLRDFINHNNSDVLMNGSKIIFDYTFDSELEIERMDFLKLRQYDEIVGLMDLGYNYAQRIDAKGQLDFLTRKSVGAPMSSSMNGTTQGQSEAQLQEVGQA